MHRNHLIRVGVLGQVGRFRAAEPVRYPRGARVVCRTRRGLEVGDVLTVESDSTAEHDGTLLRRVTVEDELLLARLSRHREEAYEACHNKLIELGLSSALIDVEHLFDGKSIYFYFLGEVTEQVTAITAELAEVYDAQVQFRQFTDNVIAGCGPGCGTDEAAGCASGGCASCAINGACHNSP